MKIFLNDVSELLKMSIKFQHLSLSGTLDINRSWNNSADFVYFCSIVPVEINSDKFTESLFMLPQYPIKFIASTCAKTNLNHIGSSALVLSWKSVKA
jgi:hypothetical protein